MKHEKFSNICKLHRRNMLTQANIKKCSHIGSALSIVEIMVYLYYHEMTIKEKQDGVVLSKGHSSLILYSILYDMGFINEIEFNNYYENGSYLIGHVNHKVNGIKVSTGSLGHGLPIAVGMSYANRISKSNERIFCIIGDGECDEGSIWESLRFISLNPIKNLIIFVDFNKLQGFPINNQKKGQTLLINMLKSMDLNFFNINGHSFSELQITFEQIKQLANEKSTLILANTIKGKGVSFMENRLEWHYKSPNDEEYQRALNELK